MSSNNQRDKRLAGSVVKRVSRRQFVHMSALGATAAFVAACAPATVAPAVKETVIVKETVEVPKEVKKEVIKEVTKVVPVGVKTGGTLIDAWTQSPPGLDPHVEGLLTAIRATSLIYQPLVDIDAAGNPVAVLAESWEIKDASNYVLHLRKGVKFHDGKEMDADDVKASLDRILNPDVGSWKVSYIDMVSEVVAVDKYTIELKLSKPFVALLPNLWRLDIMPKSLATGPAADLKSKAVGTGPWVLDKWTPNVSMEFKRHDGYWKPGQPYLDGLTIQFVPDETTAVADLRTGRVNHLMLQDSRNFELLKGKPNVLLYQSAGFGPNINQINFRKKEMADQRVRQALSLGLDREAILTAAGAGLGEVSGIIPPALADWCIPAKDLPYYTRDVDKARALLKEAGYGDGLKMDVITVPSVAVMQISAELMAAQWREIGVECEVRSMEGTTWVNTKNKPPFDWFVANNVDAPGPDPDSLFFPLVHSSSAAAQQEGFSNPELDKLLEAGRAEADKAKRVEIYKQAQIMVAELQPLFFTYTPTWIDATTGNVKGAEFRADNLLRGLDGAWLA